MAVGPTLNALMGAAPALTSALRRRLSQILSADFTDGRRVEPMATSLLVPMSEVRLELPAAVGGFTDFLTSIYHTERGGRITRPDSPVPAAFRYLPIAYNGRASSVRASGEAIRRPNGQWRSADGQVRFGPSEQLDFELEVGMFVGRGNALGEPITNRRCTGARIRVLPPERLVGARSAAMGKCAWSFSKQELIDHNLLLGSHRRSDGAPPCAGLRPTPG